jgi:hypothetical protein
VTLNNDMVQEVKVQSSNFAAEYGAGGMNISAVTKSGSAQFHGSLYVYNRDARFAANDRANNIAGIEKPKSKFNYFGGNVGGPVLLPGFNKDRNKLFFFVATEVQRQQVDPGARFGVVPTLKQRQGDFSEFLTPNGQNLRQNVGQLYIPGGFPGAGTPAPNNNLAPYISPIGRVLTNLYPEPNYSRPDNQFNYVLSQLEPTNRVDFKTRIDYNITSNTKAYVRVARENETVEGARGVWWGASEVALPSPNVGSNVGRSVVGTVVTVLSPTMTNEALVSWSRLTLDNAYKDPSRMTLAGNGIEMPGPFGSVSPYIPGIIPNWGGGVSNMWSSANDMYAYNDELTFENKVTKIAGAHNLKFGARLQRLQKQQNFNNNEEMYLVFVQDRGWNPASTGNAVGDILTGQITAVDRAGSDPPEGEFRMWNSDFFAQDSWKLRPNVTLELGVRAGYWTNNDELSGLGAYFDPNQFDPTRGQFLDPGTFEVLNGYCYISTGCAGGGILPNRSPFAMPRVNLAWDVDGQGNNVVRGGYGLFYNRNMGNVEYDQALRIPPASYQINADVGNTPDPGGTGRGLTYETLRFIRPEDRIGGVGVSTLDPDNFTFPKTHSFSLSYARRIPFNQVLEAAYVGTRGRDLVSRVNGNAIPEGTLTRGTIGNSDLTNPLHRVALDDNALNTFRPYRSFPSLNVYDFEGESNYNSLQVTLSRQSSSRLQYFATYTLARTKGTLGDEYRQRDPFNAARTYGIRQEDRTHVFNLSWNAMLPDPIKEGGNPFAKGILNGWQLSGISTVASGTPIWLGFAGQAGSADIAQAYYGTPDVVLLTENGTQGSGLAPVYTCDPRAGGNKVGEYLFDINCISFPAFGEVGEVLPPYDLRTPTRSNHDITLFKNFAFRGDQKIQFRLGVFNMFNRAFATTSVTRSDLDLTMETVCNRVVENVPNGSGGTVGNVCDPTGGFSFTQNTINNFGKINIMRGRRIIEFALKYYF